MSNDLPEQTQPRRGLVGRVLGDRYRVTRLVAAGATTLIADAEDTELGRPVTVKLVRPEFAESEEFRNRFRATMRSVSSLAHPNIADVFDWGEELVGQRTSVYTIVEYLGGGSLRDLFDRGRSLDPSQALLVGLEACRGLDFAHRKGLVHSELTPSKLVFGDDRRLRIVDFGLAALLGEAAWSEPATLPTHVARYSSPEQALSQPLDDKTDVYALALVLVEAVSGRVPFASRSTVATLSARIGKLMPASADLGPLASVLERAGRPDAADRSTAAEFGRALVLVAGKLPRPSPIPIMVTSPPDDVTRMRRPDDPTGGIVRPPDAGAPDEAGSAAASASEGVVTQGGVAQPPVQDEPPADPVPPPTSSTSADAGLATRHIARGTTLEAVRPAEVEPEAPPASEPDPSSIEEVDRRPRRWPVVLAGLVLLAALGALAFLASVLFRGAPTDPVPDLRGVSVAAARTQLAEFEWELDVRTERSDERPEPGQIIRTEPETGIELAENEPLLLIVSGGPELRPLPELQGLTLGDAETALAELQLVALSATEEFDEEAPAGTVVAWSVPADTNLTTGSGVEPGTEVAVVVSSGPAPLTVPQLAGLTVDEATAALAELLLSIDVAEAVFDNEVPDGVIVSITPLAGEVVERGATVAVLPSKGQDLVVLPDLAELTLPQAREALAEAGLQVGAVIGNSRGTFTLAEVGGDEVDAGEQLLRNTAIDVVFL